jgi:effector-binding domain-containing protein
MPASEFKIERREPLHTAVVRRSAGYEGLMEAIGSAFGTVFPALAVRGVAPLSMPLIHYTDMAAAEVGFEGGAVVAEPVIAGDGIEPGELPGGDVATAVHSGPYEELPSSHAALTAWIAAQGRQPAGAPWEEYVTDPVEGSDSATWRTVISYPLV